MRNVFSLLCTALMPAALGLACPATAAESRSTGSTWTIIQSARDPLALVGAAAARRAPGAQVMSGSDCVEFRPGVYVLARPGQARPSGVPVPGSYVKRCTPKAGSVAALGLSAVDPSFARMRDRPVNLDGSDIVSTVRSRLLLRPWYVPDANDPREGLRMAVEDVAGPRRVIERDCNQAEVARNGGYIAIACAVEQVGEAALYRMSVYRASDLTRIRTEQRCRRPQFAAGRVLACAAQIVRSNGQIIEQPRRITF